VNLPKVRPPLHHLAQIFLQRCAQRVNKDVTR
jgi:hypothetical protein